MPNYIVNAHSRSVFPDLTGADGSTVEADPGEVIALHASVAEDVIKAHVTAGILEATSDPVTVKQAPVVDDDQERVAAEKALTRKAAREQKAAEKAAAEQAAREAADAEAAEAAEASALADQTDTAAAETADTATE